jgi:hypothetical protein
MRRLSMAALLLCARGSEASAQLRMSKRTADLGARS